MTSPSTPPRHHHLPENITVAITRARQASFGAHCSGYPVRHRCTTRPAGGSSSCTRTTSSSPRPRTPPPRASTPSTGGTAPRSNGPSPGSSEGRTGGPRYRGVDRSRLSPAHRAAAVNPPAWVTVVPRSRSSRQGCSSSATGPVGSTGRSGWDTHHAGVPGPLLQHDLPPGHTRMSIPGARGTPGRRRRGEGPDLRERPRQPAHPRLTQVTGLRPAPSPRAARLRDVRLCPPGRR